MICEGNAGCRRVYRGEDRAPCLFAGFTVGCSADEVLHAMWLPIICFEPANGGV